MRSSLSLRLAAGALLVAAPWIQPFAPGPSANVVPWLLSAACTVGLFLLLPAVRAPRGLLVAAAMACLWVLFGPATGPLDRATFVGACAVILLACSAGRAAAEDERLVTMLASAWLAAAAFSALVALAQYFGLLTEGAAWAVPAQAGEAIGNLRQRNQLASHMTIGLAGALWLVQRRRLPWLAGLAVVALLAAATAATTSRTGLVEWIAVLVLALLWRAPAQRPRLALAAAALALYAAATWLLPPLLEHATGVTADNLMARLEANLGCSSRGVLWFNVLQLIAQHPWRGWGWGELDYAHYTHLYGDAPRFCDILDNAHNLPLHIAAELGLPAALAFCAVVAWLGLRARPWAEADATRQLAWTVLCAIALHSLVEYPLWYGPFQLALGLAAGLLLRAGAPVVARELRMGIAVLAAAGIAYAGWDYDRVSQIYLEPQQRRAIWRDDTLAQVRRSWLFAGQARFAELTLTTVTRENAAWVERTGEAMLHYSPEPRVIERVIEAATLQGHLEEAVAQLARFRAAFPAEYAQWSERNRRPLPTPPAN